MFSVCFQDNPFIAKCWSKVELLTVLQMCFSLKPSHSTEVPQVVFDLGYLRWRSYLLDCLLEFHFENSTMYPGDVDNVYHFTHVRGAGAEGSVCPGDPAQILSLSYHR